MTIKSGTYTWKFSCKADAQKVGEELEALYEQHQIVTPQHVVEAAKEQSSEMHGLFTWDDTEAARKQRQSEARYVMRNIIVSIPSNSNLSEPKIIPLRATVNVMTDQGRGYMPIAIAMEQKETRTQVLENALKDLQAWRRKYEALEELAKVFDAIDAVAVQLTKKLAA